MNKSYLYTETAFHHQGDISFLKGLVDASLESGAKGIKFQVLTSAPDFISLKHKAFKELNSYCLNLNQWKEVFEYTKKRGLDIIIMPLNLEAFKLTELFPIKFIDIHSVSFFDNLLLNKVKNLDMDIILGVGGRTLEEIIEKKIFFGNKLKVLMTGFQSFPSKIEEVKIGKIFFLKKMFPDLEIGYADHSSYDDEYSVKSNEYARILGATIFEKHITTAEGIDRVDFSAAVAKDKISLINEKLNFIDENIVTTFEKSFFHTESEVTYRNRQLRCVTTQNVEQGEVLTFENMALKLVEDQSDTYYRLEDLNGRKVNKFLEKDQSIRTFDII